MPPLQVCMSVALEWTVNKLHVKSNFHSLITVSKCSIVFLCLTFLTTGPLLYFMSELAIPIFGKADLCVTKLAWSKGYIN